MKFPRRLDDDFIEVSKKSKIEINSIEMLTNSILSICDFKEDKEKLKRLIEIIKENTTIKNVEDCQEARDLMNEKYLDLCFVRKEAVEKYKRIYATNVVQKIKNKILYKSTNKMYDDPEKNLLKFKPLFENDTCEEMPGVIGMVKRAKGLIEVEEGMKGYEEYFNVETENKNIKNYFKQLH